MRNIFKVLSLAVAASAVAIALLLAGAYAWLHSNPDNFREPLEYVLSELLERELKIGKVLEAQLGADTYLVAEDVSLANPEGSRHHHFAKSTQLLLDINLPSLWQEGPVLIHQLELDDAELNLLAPADQPPSWAFWPGREKKKSDNSAPFPVIISSGQVREAIVRYLDPDRDVLTQLSKLEITQPEGQEHIELIFKGVVNGQVATLQGTAGPTRALFTGLDLSVDLNLKLGDLSMVIRGSAGNLALLEGLSLDLEAESPQSRPVLDLLGMPEVRDGPLQFSGKLTPAGYGVSIDATGKLGDFELALQGAAENPRELDGINADFVMGGPSLAEAGVMLELELENLPDVPYRAAGSVERRGKLLKLSGGQFRIQGVELMVDGRLPGFPDIDDWHLRLEGQKVDLSLIAPLVGIENIPGSDYQLSGEIEPNDRGVELLKFTLKDDKSSLTVDGAVGQAPTYHGTRLHVNLAGDNMQATAPWLGLQKMPAEPFQLAADVQLNDRGWGLSEGHLQSPTLELTLDGQMDKLINTTKLQARMGFSSPDLAGTLQAYGIETGDGLGKPISFTGDINGIPDALNVSNGTFRFGASTGTVEGEMGDLQDLKRLALKATISSPDIHELLPIELYSISPNTPIVAAGTLGFKEDALLLNDFRVQLPQSDITLSGNLQIERSAKRTLSSQLQIEGSSTQGLERLFGNTPVLGDNPFRLNAGIEGSGSHYRVHPFKLEAGTSDLAGTIVIETSGTPDFQADLHSDVLYLPFLLPDLEELEQEEQAREAAGEDFDIDEYTDSLTSEELQERIIPTRDLKLGFLRRFQGNLDYTIDQLSLREGVNSKGHMVLSLHEGKLSSRHLEWDGTYSSGQAQLSVDSSGDTNQLQLTLNGQRMPLLRLFAGEPDKAGDAAFKANISARGNSPRELAASLTGAIAFHGGGGTLDNNGLDLLMGDLLGEIFDRLNPTSEQQAYTRVECNAGAVMVRAGLVEAVPGFILRSDKLDYVAAGSIDLKTESLDLAFSTRSRKGIGISAGRTLTNYVKLGGTLANPRLTLDAKGAAVSGSAAVATAGWSILAEGLWDRWVATAGDPCKRLLKKARKDKQRDYEALLRGIDLE